MHKCPHHNCTKQIPDNLYACKQHWFLLPQNIRSAIWAGYNGSGDWERADTEARAFWLRKTPAQIKNEILQLIDQAAHDWEWGGAENKETGELSPGDPDFPVLKRRIATLLEQL